jgi:hypothetical protein
MRNEIKNQFQLRKIYEKNKNQDNKYILPDFFNIKKIKYIAMKETMI